MGPSGQIPGSAPTRMQRDRPSAAAEQSARRARRQSPDVQETNDSQLTPARGQTSAVGGLVQLCVALRQQTKKLVIDTIKMTKINHCQIVGYRCARRQRTMTEPRGQLVTNTDQYRIIRETHQEVRNPVMGRQQSLS